MVEHRSGVRADLPLRGLRWAGRVDTVLAILEDMAVLPSLCRQRGVSSYARRPLSAMSCWWAEELVSGSEERRAQIVSHARGIDRLFVFSRNQVEVFADAGVPAEKVLPVRFGVDPDYNRPPLERRPIFDVLAAGVDRGRDFDTLVFAAGRLPDIRFDIFTQPGRIRVDPLPSNVTLHAPVGMGQHRENLQAARLVVIPTHELAYPTGQSVLLEAMASGAATAATFTPAMEEYIHPDATAALPLHDPVGAADVIADVLVDE